MRGPPPSHPICCKNSGIVLYWLHASLDAPVVTSESIKTFFEAVHFWIRYSCCRQQRQLFRTASKARRQARDFEVPASLQSRRQECCPLVPPPSRTSAPLFCTWLYVSARSKLLPSPTQPNFLGKRCSCFARFPSSGTRLTTCSTSLGDFRLIDSLLLYSPVRFPW